MSHQEGSSSIVRSTSVERVLVLSSEENYSSILLTRKERKGTRKKNTYSPSYYDTSPRGLVIEVVLSIDLQPLQYDLNLRMY